MPAVRSGPITCAPWPLTSAVTAVARWCRMCDLRFIGWDYRFRNARKGGRVRT